MIGRSIPRLDGRDTVAGATRYAADLAVPGLLHARLVLSPYAHARIGRIDPAGALGVPGVVAVLAAADLPIRAGGDARFNEPLAREEAFFAGQPLAIVVAESEAAAADAVAEMLVEYELLPAAIDVEAAMRPDAPAVRRLTGELDTSLRAAHGGGGHAGEGAVSGPDETGEPPPEALSPNVIERIEHVSSDVDAALASADLVVRRSARTGWVYQAYLEPQVAIAAPEPSGGLTVWSSTQGVFYTQKELAKLFGLPAGSIRVVSTPMGGAFGAKAMVVEPLAVGAALHLRRPVRLELTRLEDFAATNPVSACRIELAIGARRDGAFLGLEARVVSDYGAFAENGAVAMTCDLLGGVYRWPAHRVTGHGVLTNRVGTGYYRGPGAPPAAFALETAIDELAEALGLDPVELRLRNLVAPGDLKLDGTPWEPIGAREVLEALGRHPLWRERGALPPGEGVGLAIGVWPGANAPASSLCRFDGDGTFTLVTGLADMTGASTTFAAIAAETIGVPIESVHVVFGDSASAPYTPYSGGSVITYSVGPAVRAAAEDARRQVLAVAAEELEIDARDLVIADGAVRPRGSPERGIALGDLATRIHSGDAGQPPVVGRGGAAVSRLSPAVSGDLAHVRVDAETGRVEVLRLVAAQDVGRALNPALIDGQLAGGAAQGIGWALLEELVHDEAGALASGSFLDYAVPMVERVPPIETVLVEVPSAEGPYGAKGVGEAPVIPVGAAVANAVAAATGVRPDALPITPPRLWSALRERVAAAARVAAR